MQGTPRSHIVKLINNGNDSVYLSSVSGSHTGFYASFFDSKVVPPHGGHTTFNVVFLPREQGIVNSNIVVHTSFGQLALSVRGAGRECPYRLRPLMNVKAPLNATLTQEIKMFNPHSKAIQILEVGSNSTHHCMLMQKTIKVAVSLVSLGMNTLGKYINVQLLFGKLSF